MTQTYRGDPMKSLARPENINSYNSFQAGLTLNPTFGIWHPTLETMLFKQWLKMNTHVGNKLDNPVAVFQLTNAFDFKLLTASLVMTAQTEGNMGNKFIRQGYFNTDLSLLNNIKLTERGESSAIILVDSAEAPLYEAFADDSLGKSMYLTIETNSTEFPNTKTGASAVIISNSARKQLTKQPNNQNWRLDTIITNDRSENSDRLYIYKAREK